MKMHQYVVNKLVLNLLSVKDFSDALDKLKFKISDDVVSSIANMYIEWSQSCNYNKEMLSEKLDAHISHLNNCVNYMILQGGDDE